ncbi:hypothetical protein B0H11DRAFT_2244801 [Mycena galericulata]|nr:hypothetical protein B0H11DRAFT_2244801 [Mycena galericulata]
MKLGQGEQVGSHTSVHLPDIRTWDGLLDVLIVTNLVCFLDVLDRRNDEGLQHTVYCDWASSRAIPRARDTVKDLLTWFTAHYAVKLGGQNINIEENIFQREDTRSRLHVPPAFGPSRHNHADEDRDGCTSIWHLRRHNQADEERDSDEDNAHPAKRARTRNYGPSSARSARASRASSPPGPRYLLGSQSSSPSSSPADLRVYNRPSTYFAASGGSGPGDMAGLLKNEKHTVFGALTMAEAERFLMDTPRFVSSDAPPFYLNLAGRITRNK